MMMLLGMSVSLQIPWFTQNYTKLHNNVRVSFINKKGPVRRLFEPEAFHTENYPTMCLSLLNPVSVILSDNKLNRIKLQLRLLEYQI